jgi:hypothetical protein
MLGPVSVSAADDVSGGWEGIKKNDHSERAVVTDSGIDDRFERFESRE